MLKGIKAEMVSKLEESLMYEFDKYASLYLSDDIKERAWCEGAIWKICDIIEGVYMSENICNIRYKVNRKCVRDGEVKTVHLKLIKVIDCGEPAETSLCMSEIVL